MKGRLWRLLVLGAVAVLATGPVRAAAPGHEAMSAPAAAPDDAGRMRAAASVLRPPSPAQMRLAAAALDGPVVAAARLRLAPLSPVAAEMHVVGTSISRTGLYLPLRGADGSDAGWYALWLDEGTGAAALEADLVYAGAGVHARVRRGGETVIDDVWAADEPDEPFWRCLVRCMDSAMSHKVYIVVRALCGRACTPVGPLCELCLVGIGIMEVGMISGCVDGCAG